MNRNSLKISITYILVGIVWIYLSDSVDSPTFFANSATFQTVKGIAYVLFTGVILYWYLRHSERKHLLISERFNAGIRKNARELETINNQITGILESVPNGFFSINEQWIITYWNKEAERLLGRPRDAVLGQNIWDLFPEATNLKFYDYYHRAMLKRKAYRFQEFYIPVDAWLEVNVYPTQDGISVFFRDVTYVKKSNIERKRRIKELAASNAELEQFAYIASHDLQEPLRMVTSFLTQIEKKYNDKLDDKGRQYIHFAVDGAKRMRKIILDLLEYSRIGKEDSEIEDIVVNDLIDDIALLNATLFKEEKITLNVAKLPVIKGRKTMIQQVFQNLIINAVRYKKAEQRPVIGIDCEEIEGFWKFSVTDNGIGIDNAFSEKIFILFQRLHNKEEFSGTGMGLAICKKIVENHGGKIWLESSDGDGSSFYFTIKK